MYDKCSVGKIWIFHHLFFYSVACEECFYRHIIVFIPGSAAVLALLCALMLKQDFDQSSVDSPEPDPSVKKLQSK